MLFTAVVISASSSVAWNICTARTSCIKISNLATCCWRLMKLSRLLISVLQRYCMVVYQTLSVYYFIPDHLPPYGPSRFLAECCKRRLDQGNNNNNNNNNNTSTMFMVLSSCLKHCESSPWFTRWVQHVARWPPTISPPVGCQLTTLTIAILLLLSTKADTHFTIPRKVEGWVDLVGWLHTEMVYPLAHGHPSKY